MLVVISYKKLIERSYSFIPVNKFSKSFRTIRFSHNFSNSVTVDFWFRYSLLQKFPQAKIIFFYQSTVMTIKL